MKTLLLIFLYCSSLAAWWDTPHMLIVEIAKRECSAEVIAQAEKLATAFAQELPQSCSSLTVAACFADDIAQGELSFLKQWHGTQIPYDPEQILNLENPPKINEQNILFAIEKSIEICKNPMATEAQKAFMLCTLIHCVGDIHQPLHCAQLYSHQFPDGDRNGHRFTLKNSSPNLHILWDSMVGLVQHRLYRPLSPEDARWLSAKAEELAKEFPKEELPESNNLDIKYWCEESYKIAKEVAYADICPYSEPSSFYVERGQTWAKRQVVLAGYRLAALLEEIFE